MSGVEGELRAALSELVAIDSTSARDNSPVIDLLERRLGAAGFRCQRHRYLDDAGAQKTNLVARKGGEGPVALALAGHTDCVPFDPSWTEALRLTERDGKLFGRGACDTKAFVACALVAAERTKLPEGGSLALVFTGDEEVGCLGAKRLAEAKLLSARRAIVGEPTSLCPVRANKGYCLAEVEVRGQEGHSAYPEKGASAIFRAAKLLGAIEEYAQGELRREGDARFDPRWTTLNVGVISGGKAKNIIPGECRFTLEWRPIPGQPVRQVAERVEQMISELRRADPGFEAKLRVLRTDRGFSTPDSSELVQFLAGESGNAPDTVAFGTEGPQLVEMGAEPVVFGPGDIRAAHRSGEFVPAAELTRCEQILERAIQRFAAAP